MGKQIDEAVLNELDQLTDVEIDKLLDLMDIGIQDDLDREEKTMIICTESELDIKQGLTKLKKWKTEIDKCKQDDCGCVEARLDQLINQLAVGHELTSEEMKELKTISKEHPHVVNDFPLFFGCSKCDSKYYGTVEHPDGADEHFCVKHWVEYEGKDCLEGDLIGMQEPKVYRMHKKVAEEIIKQFPKLAKKYKDVLDQVLKQKSGKES